MMEKKDKVLTCKQAADYINASESFLKERFRVGEIQAFKVGSHWRVRQSSLDKYMRENEQRPVA